jgi:hypothetical protein
MEFLEKSQGNILRKEMHRNSRNRQPVDADGKTKKLVKP